MVQKEFPNYAHKIDFIVKIRYNRHFPWRSITIYDITELVKAALSLATTEKDIQAKFAITGIRSFHPDILHDLDYISGYAIDWTIRVKGNVENTEKKQLQNEEQSIAGV